MQDDGYLNEQFIQGMFQLQTPDDREQPLQEVSLNLTVSSRSTKHQKKNTQRSQQLEHSQQLNIFKLAEHQLSKFSSWIMDSDSKFESNLNNINDLLSQLDRNNAQAINQQDLSLIKGQLFRKQNQIIKQGFCQDCQDLKYNIQQLEATMDRTQKTLNLYQQKIQTLTLDKQMDGLKEEILNKVQINLLNEEINQLNGEVSVLKSQKNNLEKTFLFNKTKNSQLQLKMQLQKSKGLSAAKNSTNSSQILNRNETIVFIDPIQSDVEEWIKFFQNQKYRYMSMCKKQQGDRMKQLGRSFTKEEKSQLHSQGRLFIIFSSIKEIWKNLVKIKQNTNSFLASETKNFLKEKFTNNNSQIQNGNTLKDEHERLNSRLNKLMKLNQYLLCEKQNLEEINQGLKQERVKQNVLKNKLEEELTQSLRKVNKFIVKVKEYQEQKKMLMKNLSAKDTDPPGDLKRHKRVQSRIISSGSRGHRSSSYKVQYP